ncbi:peptidoglycan-binding protein [soil metagenome]
MAQLEGLAKATIINTETNARVQVMYNPEQYSLDLGNQFAEVGIPGLSRPPLQYVRGKGRTLSMDLFFDSYEEPRVDVRTYTAKLTDLLDQSPKTRAPPVLLFMMGQLAFRCVLVDVQQRFTMFDRQGSPVRAILQVRFQEYDPIDIVVQSGLFIGPPSLQTVTKGQTLSQIAADTMGDSSRWREIADANDIDDPFNLTPGSQLVVPDGKKP